MNETEISDYTKRWLAEREKRAARTAHRRVPLSDVPRGVCRWCERTIIGTRGQYAGRPDPKRSWCRQKNEGRACWHDYLLHSDARAQFNFLVERDGKQCADCAGQPMRWERSPASHCLDWSNGSVDKPFLRELWKREDAPDCRWLGAMTLIYARSIALEVDHDIPLWSIDPTGLTLAERRWYFGPGNLKLRCTVCHAAKTAREAGERAARRRQCGR